MVTIWHLSKKIAQAPADTDHDGLPEDWEEINGLDRANPADGAAYRPDGYTNLEYYLNELASGRR